MSQRGHQCKVVSHKVGMNIFCKGCALKWGNLLSLYELFPVCIKQFLCIRVMNLYIYNLHEIHNFDICSNTLQNIIIILDKTWEKWMNKTRLQTLKNNTSLKWMRYINVYCGYLEKSSEVCQYKNKSRKLNHIDCLIQYFVNSSA